MKKNNLYFSALVLILGLSFTNCHSKSDNSLYQTNSLLVNYVNGLLAGNCAQVTKSTTAALVATYEASGTLIPTGGCNAATIGSTYYTDTTTIVTTSDAYFDLITAVLDVYPTCAAASALVKGTTTGLTAVLNTSSYVGVTKTGTTAANIIAKAAATTVDTTDSLSNFHPKNCYRVKIGSLNTIGVYCASATDSTTAQNNVKYYVVNSVITDMGVNFVGNRDILKAAKSNSTGTADVDYVNEISLYSKAAIDATRMMTSTEISTLTTNRLLVDTYASVFIAFAASKLVAASLASSAPTTAAAVSSAADGALTCFSSLTENSTVLKDYVMRIPTVYRTTNTALNSNITSADRLSVTTPFIPSISCKYGAGFTAATTTSVVIPASTATASSSVASAAVGFCPSTYTQF